MGSHSKAEHPAKHPSSLIWSAAAAVVLFGAFLFALLNIPQADAIPHPSMPVPTDQRILRVAGLKERGLEGQQCFVFQDFPARMQSTAQKILRLVNDHPNVDLVVLPEDLFDGFSPGRPVFVNCPDGATNCTFASDGSPQSDELYGYLEYFLDLADTYDLNLSFVVQEVWHPDPIKYPHMADPTSFESSVVVNHHGEVVMKKRRTHFCGYPNLPPAAEEYCQAALATVHYTTLRTHAGANFTMVPIICANRFEPTWLEVAKNFNVDVVANSSQENSNTRFDHLSEYLTTGSPKESNATLGCYEGETWNPSTYTTTQLETDLIRGGYYPGFLEEYAIKRNVIKADGVFVHADGVDEQAGFYPLNRRKVRAWDLGGHDYVYGEVELPHATQTVSSAGFGNRTIAISDMLESSGKLYLATYNLDGLEIIEMDSNNTARTISQHGFGDRRNYYASDLTLFQGQLYVATQFTNRDDNYAFPNQYGGEIWRRDFASKTWQRVVTDGGTDRSNQAMTAFAEHANALFVGTHNPMTGPMLYTAKDGADWSPAFATPPWQWERYRVNDLASFRGKLFAGLSNQAELWANDGGAWSQVTPDGFGDPQSEGITKFFVFQDMLYAAVANYETGAELWRSSDGASWEQVNSDGFGDAANGRIWDLAIFNGRLVAATQNFQGGEIWTSVDGTTWQQRTQSSQQNGFGNALNRYIHSLQPFAGYLYAGTFNGDGAELWRTRDGIRWSIVKPSITPFSS
ncbi:MAG: hypothetical protein HY340_01320 [Candidatus Kerfeldbacteria bacterium]|nr:hypothetical protein [Candidatus Kerfeldbacteria bacterium]